MGGMGMGGNYGPPPSSNMGPPGSMGGGYGVAQGQPMGPYGGNMGGGGPQGSMGGGYGSISHLSLSLFVCFTFKSSPSSLSLVSFVALSLLERLIVGSSRRLLFTPFFLSFFLRSIWSRTCASRQTDE